MKHTPADVVAAYLQAAVLAASVLPEHKFFVNSLPADPLKSVVITDDLSTSLKASRDTRTGEPTIFHGVQLMLRDRLQVATAAAGNALNALVDAARRTQPEATVELPDPESTEAAPLPAVSYLIWNLSRAGGISLGKEPETGNWVFFTTLRASISEL
jgi:hypothetical protein